MGGGSRSTSSILLTAANLPLPSTRTTKPGLERLKVEGAGKENSNTHKGAVEANLSLVKELKLRIWTMSSMNYSMMLTADKRSMPSTNFCENGGVSCSQNLMCNGTVNKIRPMQKKQFSHHS